jgi:PIN domain nuclease of toxin-antitoxin system
MKLLIDTHVFIWLASEPDKLSGKAKEAILSQSNQLYLSLVSLWEMQIKSQLGKLALDVPLSTLWHDQKEMNQIELLPILPEHIWELDALPHIHRDPFDRLIIAQAIKESFIIVSADTAITQYPVTTIW